MTEDRGPEDAGATVVHPIEQESYRILAQRLDLSGRGPGPATVVARIVHATAEPELAGSVVVDEVAVAAGVAALRGGAPIICDVEMVRSGISAPDARCLLGEVPVAPPAGTRSAAAMELAAERHPEGAVFVVGCAPTALEALNRRIEDGRLRPALVVGTPVGFVGAEASKERLLRVAGTAGVPVIALRGERGGAAVAAAAVNALGRLAGGRTHPRTVGRVADAGGPPAPAMVLIGHGTRSVQGEAELRAFCRLVAAARPEVPVSEGFIEFMAPTLPEALEAAAGPGTGAGHSVIAVPLVLLGAGHMKDDGPVALAHARARHPGVTFSYGRDLGVHPTVLEVVAQRVVEAVAHRPVDAVVLVGRGSSDPDANADLVKAARLLADGRRLTSPRPPPGPLDRPGAGLDRPGGGPVAEPPGPPLGMVEACFVSLAAPDVAGALTRCRLLGARRILVVPYFLFAGLLVDRISDQAHAWAAAHDDTEVVVGGHMGVDPRLVELVWHRYDEVAGGPVHMNCDGCLHRTPLPGYESRVGVAPPTATSRTSRTSRTR